jgi:GTP-binding protein HflX
MPSREDPVSTAPPKAFLIGAYPKTTNEATAQGHVQELGLLVDTFGAITVGHILCFMRTFDPATFLTSGKLQEIKEHIQETHADVAIFDNEISPAQQRNLEKELGCSVMDRTEVILEVFAQRAHTKEAHLQVELARTQYLAPRLKRLWTHLSRQAGTSGSGGPRRLGGDQKV